MIRVQRVLADAAGALAANRAPHALIGGLAVSARVEPRFTRDVDFAVSVPGDAAVEALLQALVKASYVVVSTVEHDSTRRLATARLLPPGEPQQGVVVDLLFASSGIEPEVTAAADLLEVLPGLTVPVAKLGHLIALKVLSDAPERPQDAADLRALAEDAQAADFDLARQALALIAERGYGRGKDLLAELKRLTTT
jgi:predicted nucleotidyltransferase